VLSNTGPADGITGGGPSLQVSATGACLYAKVSFGLPAPSPAIGNTGIDARNYINGHLNFDVLVQEPTVANMLVVGDKSQIYICASLGAWTHISIPVSQIYGGALGALPSALNITFNTYVGPCTSCACFSVADPFGVAAGNPIAALNNLVWTPY
jgi:hypothetical protein